MKYLVAIPIKDEAEIFEFKTEEDRQEFIEEMEQKHPGFNYATSETE